MIMVIAILIIIMIMIVIIIMLIIVIIIATKSSPVFCRNCVSLTSSLTSRWVLRSSCARLVKKSAENVQKI